MAATRTPRTTDRTRSLAVACSGGRDSIALLHATVRAAAGQGIEVVALHVHHGLSPHADAWLAHVEAQCATWAREGLPVRFDARRLEGRPAKAESVEAWARKARYRVLREMALAAGADIVLLAHHRRDQAETLLLQALRGAGVAGLAGMPARIERDAITWMRPWLSHGSTEIDAYVRMHNLAHIEDDSNTDTRYARNRLRADVWPALLRAFPHAESALADAAQWSAEATACLDALATADLETLVSDDALDIAAWQRLDGPRRGNALRAWLHGCTGRVAPASLTTRLHAELIGEGTASWQAPGGNLHRDRGRLRYVVDAARGSEAERERTLRIARAGRYALPGWGGVLVARRVKEEGVPLAWLGHVELRAREGGERFQAGVGRPARSLKKQYQAADIPARDRDGPLVYSGGQLLFVPGLGMDARVLGLPGQTLVRLEWLSG